MRIARLDLSRYGRFTDRVIELPYREPDFHLLVGANEAGKSTLRCAILDLLFGIEMRSPYNFRHAYGDMRLGARVEHGDAALDFVRVKARTRTLQAPDGSALPDTALADFLGGIERGFFEQMFGLDHQRLVAGGRDILSAANDVGQILFQSATGIASFGTVREALEQEADALWAKRRAGDREYYIAADALARAEESLKQATVRTRDWVAARDAVAGLEREAGELRARFHALAERRARLERARRVAPVLAGLRGREEALAALGTVAPLPPEALKQLADAEIAMAQSAKAQGLHETQAAGLAERLAGIRPDAAVLARVQDIEALVARRQQVRNHPGDIAKRQEEARAHWKTLEGLARQLGWPAEEEDTLTRMIPSQVVRSAATTLIRRHATLTQTLENAREAESAKRLELDDCERSLARLPATVVPPALSATLAAAQALGDLAGQERRLVVKVERAERDLADARADLGPWQPDGETLRALYLPAPSDVSSLLGSEQDLQNQSATLAQRIAEHRAAIADLELEIDQYRTAHQPVALAELKAARAARDALWGEIRTGTQPLELVADPYETRVAAADALADRRHDKAREAATLQSQLDRREGLARQLARFAEDAANNARRQADFAAVWEARMAALGLPGMGLAQIGPWRTARELVLAAAAALAAAREDLDALRRQAEEVRAALAAALAAAPSAATEESLPSLVLRAAERVDGARRAAERRAALEERRAAAETALKTLGLRLAQAREDLDTWRRDWTRSLADLHLPAETDIGAAEGALAVFTRMDEHLHQMHELRDARINPMRRDLNDFAGAAADLAQELDPGLADRPPEEVARVLAERLDIARQADRDRRRLVDELEQARGRAAAEAARLEQTLAGLAPLMHAAGAGDRDALRAAIDRSDRARAFQAELRDLRRTLDQGSDGLTREVLETELAELNLAALPGELESLGADLDGLRERERENAGALQSAKTALEHIAGGDAAARADAERQEALARMGNAVERYLRTYTAARLLRWAIERYREQRQGPMLGRAGEIFADLTLGSFARLAVDYDQDPPILYGQRPNGDRPDGDRPDGERVTVDGLSDGTRDQLYLALRLAALELHLAQAPAMPFIADDLFVNWDDARARAGLAALARLAGQTQVIFLTHHDHLVPTAESALGGHAQPVRLG